MKTIILFLSIFLSALHSAMAFEREAMVLLRNDNFRPVIESVLLTDLISQDSFDGEYFKIVKGKSDDAIKVSDEWQLTLRAATTYYHLTKARQYFTQKLKSDYVSKLPKMVIRIEHTNQFSELGHFAHDNKEPQYNNALTIPAGKGLESKGVKPWKLEIWFRPSKTLNLSEIQVSDFTTQEFHGVLKNFRNQMHMQSLQRFLAKTIVAATNEHVTVGSVFTLENMVRMAGSSIIIEAGYQFFDPITKIFSRKWYWLDTAMIPEIIYHEYSHAALSDYLVLSHSTAIIEGMADFFAGEIANSPKLATKIKEYNTYNGKNAKRKQQYNIQFESTEYANTDFVFGLLWSMKDLLGEETAAPFMYELRKSLTTNSTIRGQLIDGLMSTCENMCPSPFVDKLRILKALNKKGI